MDQQLQRHNRIYLDQINGAPLTSSVVKAMGEALREWGNPASLYAEGRRAAEAIAQARGKVAALVGAEPQEITFTSSGTEANAWALRGLTRAYSSRGKEIVVSAIEHLSILHLVRQMEKEGWKVTFLPVDATGRVRVEDLKKALTPQTILVSIQWANAEVGTIQSMAELVRCVKSQGILFHSDAVAAAGTSPLDTKAIPVDALSLAAPPFGGPAGVGALFVRRGRRIAPLFAGGGQEEGRRSGTENLVGIVGMGEAAECARHDLPRMAGEILCLRDHLVEGLFSRMPQADLQGHPTQRLPHHVSFSLPGVDAEALLYALDMEGIAVGLGSACTSQTMKASHVLKAMGVEDSRALGTLTCTLGRHTTQADIDQVVDRLPRLVASQNMNLG